MQRDVQEWAKQFATSLDFIIWHYSDHPDVDHWRIKLENATQLADPAYISALPIELLAANHEALQAWAADKKVQDEESATLAAEFERRRTT